MNWGKVIAELQKVAKDGYKKARDGQANDYEIVATEIAFILSTALLRGLEP